MNHGVLGKSGLRVSRIGFGGAFVASSATQYEEANRAIHAAVESGINYFDTAPSYGNSEEVLGMALQDVKAPLVLSTKIGGRPNPFQPQDLGCLRQSVEESLRLLKRDVIDVLIIHEPDRPGQYDWWSNMAEVKGPVLGFLDDLKREGKILHTGLGGTTTTIMAHLCRSGKFDVLLTAYNYSLLYREAALEVIPAAKASGMGVIAGSPLQQGVFARRYEKEILSPGAYWISETRRRQMLALYALCDELNMELPELGLRFVLSNQDIDCVLMGARSQQEVVQNIKAAQAGPLPGDVIKRLDEIAALAPFRPYGEPFPIGWMLGNPAAYKGPGVAQ